MIFSFNKNLLRCQHHHASAIPLGGAIPLPQLIGYFVF
jgi:hypothetical protein